MNIQLTLEPESLADGTCFIASNDHDPQQSIHIDGPPDMGGKEQGMRPMQLFLCSLASCASLDVVHILRKSKVRIEHFSVHVCGTRADAIPAVFTSINLEFRLVGNATVAQLERAVELSVSKYCSVASMLKADIAVSHSVQISAP